MGIGIEKLIPSSLAVYEKAQINNLSVSAAAYSEIEEIENYNIISVLKNEISTATETRLIYRSPLIA